MTLGQWRSRGHHIRLGDEEVFVVDTPAEEPGACPPLLVIHGFPTSSVDWRPVLAALSEHRRVVLFDMPGFGLSSKPDRPYGIAGAADAAEGVIEACGLTEFDLLTHDMGDTVGGELLARHLEGGLGVGGEPVDIRRRVITNGSVYLELAQLTADQKMLWEAPDSKLPQELEPTPEVLAAALGDTMAPAGSAASNPDPAELLAAAESVCHEQGALLLPRLIRYLSDRRDNEQRFTGAIESHPSTLGIVWGAEDPIAVVAMAHRLAGQRPDAALAVLEGVGHYPSIEAPDALAAAVIAQLDG